MTTTAMTVAVIGAGAIGGFYGGLLALGGAEVTFVARGRSLEALRRHGLRLTGNLDHTVEAPATDDTTEVGPVDVVMVATKAWQVDQACRTHLPALLGPRTIVVTTQNGVGSAEVVAAHAGTERTVAGVCREWVALREPGVVDDMGGPRSLHLGRWDATPDPRVDALRRALRAGGVDAPDVDDMRTEVWRKASNVAAHGAVGAALDLPLGGLLADHRDLLGRCMGEWVAVGNAHGAHLPDSTVADNLAFLDAQDPSQTTSFQRDLTEGRPSEFASQVGALPHLGDEVDVDTPVNDTLAAVLGRRAVPTG